jgi:hypothetical protein
MNNSPLRNTGANEGRSLAFGVEHGWNRGPAALAHDNDNLALAVLIASEAACPLFWHLLPGEIAGVRSCFPIFPIMILPHDQAHPRMLRYQRSRVYPRAIMFDVNLDLHTIDELRCWQREGVPFTVIDTETDEDITRILLA